MMTAVELFAGIGGLAIGVSNAGFQHEAVIELDKDACDTIRENQRRNIEPFKQWPLYQADVRAFDFGSVKKGIDLWGAGVPCQPWSLGGKHKGFEDQRNLFPDTVAAIRTLRPKVVLIENVKGLARESFARYFEYITLLITYPCLIRRPNEAWIDHLSRLEGHHTAGRERELEYNVVFQLLNAADYGVPQRRERIFIVGFRSDLRIEWSFPSPTHSQDALVDQWVTKKYWERHKIARDRQSQAPSKLRKRLERVGSTLPFAAPWKTVRDAIAELPNPEKKSDTVIPNHDFNSGAKSYPGHTGSPLDEPAKTLKAGDHGVPGGENMLRVANGQVRYFTVRESARLQTFPDQFLFHGFLDGDDAAARQCGPCKIVRSDCFRHRAAFSRSFETLLSPGCELNRHITRWTNETLESAWPMLF